MSTSKTESATIFSEDNAIGNKSIPSGEPTNNQILVYNPDSWSYQNSAGSGAGFVNTTTAQTIGGIKSFTSTMLANAGVQVAPSKNIAINTTSSTPELDIKQNALASASSLEHGISIRNPADTTAYSIAWDTDGLSIYMYIVGFPVQMATFAGNKLTNLFEPQSAQDMVTKKYADTRWKNNTGHVPPLASTTLANTTASGFVVAASSSASSDWLPINCFNNVYSDGTLGQEWATASGVTTNFWISIQCPSPVRLWKIALRGRNSGTQRIFNWRFESSLNGTDWILLYTAPNPTYLGNTVQQFMINPLNAYAYYRLFVVQAEPVNPGLSYMQLYALTGP